MRPASVSGAASSRPAVSISRTVRPRNLCLGILAVTRHAWGVGNQRDAPPGEAVEEGRLADIGPSGDDDDRQGGRQHGSYLSAISRASLVMSSTVPSATTGAKGAAASDRVIWPMISPV